MSRQKVITYFLTGILLILIQAAPALAQGGTYCKVTISHTIYSSTVKVYTLYPATFGRLFWEDDGSTWETGLDDSQNGMNHFASQCLSKFDEDYDNRVRLDFSAADIQIKQLYETGDDDVLYNGEAEFHYYKTDLVGRAKDIVTHE